MNKEFYNNKLPKYRMNSFRRRAILRWIANSQKDILDIGCGQAELAPYLKSMGHKVSGVDMVEMSADIQKNLDYSKSFDFSGDWPSDLLEKKFDYIICSEVIEHIFDTAKLLNNIKSCLKENGKLILTTPNFLFWKNRLRILFGDFAYSEDGLLDSGHIRFFTIATLKDSIGKSGLRIEREYNFYPNLYKRNLTWLGNLFPSLFAYQIILLLSRERHK